MKLRLGLIGMNELWESRYRPALGALADRFEVRAVYCPVALLAENAAQRCGLAASLGFRALVARDDVDAVLVLSCDWLGPLPILAACELGKAVCVAGGLDWDLEQVRIVRQRIEESGVAFVAELPRRLAPATVRLKELIATHLGAPRLLFCHQRVGDGSRRSPAAWNERRPDPTTGVLVEQVDWCRYVVGCEPTSVLGVRHAGQPAGPVHDYEMFSLDFSAPGQPGSGPVAQISCGCYIPAGWPEAMSFRPPSQLQVCCERGVAFVELPATVVWFDEAGRHMESLDHERPFGETQFMHLYRAVTSLVRVTNDIEDTFRAHQIVAAGIESFAAGRRVAV